jgi:hypothetical protein
MAVTVGQRTAVLVPAQRDAPALAPLLPIQRDRRSRRQTPVRRLRALAITLAAAMLIWLAVLGGVVAVSSRL